MFIISILWILLSLLYNTTPLFHNNIKKKNLSSLERICVVNIFCWCVRAEESGGRGKEGLRRDEGEER